jgi:hypothetical protein
MLPLDSPKWSVLTHAYGSAGDIPPLLGLLEEYPPYKDWQSEPYFSLWSALCHQGDVYSASYAAVPHLVRTIEASPTRAHWTLLQLIACIEIARAKKRGPDLQTDLHDDYRAALKKLPDLVAAAAQVPWDDEYCTIALSAVAAAKGHTSLAEVLQDLDPQTLVELERIKFGEE